MVWGLAALIPRLQTCTRLSLSGDGRRAGNSETGFVFWSLPDIAVLWALVLTEDKCRRDGPLLSKLLYAGSPFTLKNFTQYIRKAVNLA